MEITPNFKSVTLRVDASPAEMRNWRVGQVLHAVATSADRGGRADLRIGAQTYQAQVPFTVRPGDRMLLEVIRTGSTPLLRPVAAERSPDPVQTALRSALPRQAALPPLLANVAQLASARSLPPLPAPVLEAARALFQRLPSPSEVTSGPGLRRALENAGTQLEAKLARPAAGTVTGGAISDDLKTGLLRLREATAQALRPLAPAAPPSAPAQQSAPVQAVARAAQAYASSTTGAGDATSAAPPAAAARPVPPLLPPLTANQPQPQGRALPLPLLDPGKLLQGLMQQVESSLARLQLNQLASQPVDGEQRNVWLLELPIRRDQAVDLLHLRIERERADDAAEGKRTATGWTVKLAFDLEGLGPVQARVGLHHGLVSTAFWSEQRDTHVLFQQHLGDLRRQLEGAGLDVGAMSCQMGQPSPPPGPAPSRTGIVDEQA